MQVVVDLNDLCILADSVDSQFQSPGYALLQRGHDPVLGTAALQQSRLAPAYTASRFWRELSLNPVGIAHPQVRHQADLVWHHIKQINAEVPLDGALLLCPSHYTEEQLSLLSGILKAQQITPRALLKRALVAGVLSRNADAYLELQLHQILLTPLKSSKGELIAEDTRALAGDGFVGAIDLLLKAIQKRFIRETRFDPLHHAATEQQLVDALPGMLKQLGASEVSVIRVQNNGEEYRAEVRRDELAQALEPLWREIKAAIGTGVRTAVDTEVIQLPGFSELNPDVCPIAPEELVGAARSMGMPPPSDAIDAPLYLTRTALVSSEAEEIIAVEAEDRPVRPDPPPVIKKSAKASSDDIATHLLCQGVALRAPRIWLAISSQGRLGLTEEEPNTFIGCCEATSAGLEIEALGDDLHINGEKLVGKRILLPTDHLSSTEVPGGATAIRVVGDVD